MRPERTAPTLMVIARNRPEEMVLYGCKLEVFEVGSATERSGCFTVEADCFFCWPLSPS